MSGAPRPPRIAVVGAGFGGLCAAIQLLRAGFDDLFLLEKAERVGGTWRENTYPGAACDTPSFAYCFSFFQKKDWTRKWAQQPEILAYIEDLAREHDLLPRIRFGAELASARWESGRWHLTMKGGATEVVDVLVSSVGQLNRPLVPAIPGLDTFGGPAFHTAEWDHSFDPRGKRVAVVGTGASAIQVVPELAREASQLVLFQRSPNWILPKNDRFYGPLERLAHQHVPGVARAYRSWLWAFYEVRYPAILGEPITSWVAKEICSRHLRAQVADPALRRALTPTYPVAAKRVLTSDDYYPAVARSNVTLVSDAVGRIEPGAVVAPSGRRFEVDAIVFATGFRSTELLAPMELFGVGGQRLADVWRDGAFAYLGVRVSGFPNLFLVYGPNTNLGHNSILFMIESEVHYVVETLRAMRARGLAWTDVRVSAQQAFCDRLQARLGRTVWAEVERSWYKTAAGRITNNWVGSTTEYFLRTRRVDLDDYELGR